MYTPFTPGLDSEGLDWPPSPSSLTRGRELMEGAELRAVAERGLLSYSAVGHSERGCQFDSVALATDFTFNLNWPFFKCVWLVLREGR